MGSTPAFRRAFVARLKQACDESKNIPPPGQGRQQVIADSLKVGPEAVSKWFKGVAMPRPDKMAQLADLLDTDQSWLAFGIQPEMDRSERKLHAREADGAIHLVWGLITLAGGHCGEPSARDPRHSFVDFYATLRGSVYPVSVALARQTARDTYEALVPDEYAELRVVVVVPVGAGRYDCLDLPLELIEEYKQRKQGGIAIVFANHERKYMIGSDEIPKIRNFAEFK